MNPVEKIIINAMARALFVQWWATWADGHTQATGERLYPMGCELYDHAPETPASAFREAAYLAGYVSALNGVDLFRLARNAAIKDGVLDTNSLPDKYWEDMGFYIAMQCLGHGVSWLDDHADPEWKLLSYYDVDFYDDGFAYYIENGTEITMPDPSLPDDAWRHSFVGKVVGYHEDLVTVEDMDGDCFDIEPSRLH